MGVPQQLNTHHREFVLMALREQIQVNVCEKKFGYRIKAVCDIYVEWVFCCV
jgi:hypothetical protein